MKYPQYVITLGARSNLRTERNKSGRFSNRDYQTIQTIVAQKPRITGFTVIRCSGFYNGLAEDSVQIIILSKDRKAVIGCARELREAFRQREVLLSRTGSGEFLAGKV